MALGAWAIRRFLMRQPRADMARLTVRGVATEMKIARGASLAKVGESIAAVAPEVLELFDKDGTLLRAIRPDQEGESTTEQPKPPKGLESDPETMRFTHVASLLAKAYEHATNVAFQKVVDLTERLEQHSEAMESRLERVESLYRKSLYDQLRSLQDEALDVIEEHEQKLGEVDPDDPDGMVKQMFSAFMQGRAQRAQQGGRGKPNGARKNGNGAAAPEPKGEA